MSNEEVVQYYIDHSDKTYPSWYLAISMIVLSLEEQVAALEAGLPPISQIDQGTF